MEQTVQWYDSPYPLLLLLAGVATFTLTLLAWNRRSAPGAYPLIFLGLSVAIWQVAYGLALFTEPGELRIVLAKVQYIGIVMVPTAWLTFAIQYTGRGNWLNAKTIPLLAVMPITTLALVWTNGSHNLIWATIEFDVSGSLSLLHLTYGNAFWVHTIYSYMVMLAGILIVAEDIFYSHRLFWQQSAAMLVSAIAPWVANWLFFIEAAPMENLDPTPFAFLVSVAVLWWAVYRVRLLDITPVALKAIFENITSGVIVLDDQERVVASNDSAKDIVGRDVLTDIGLRLRDVWPAGDCVLKAEAEESITYSDVLLGDASAGMSYDVVVSPFHDRHQRVVGRIVLLHDVSERRNAERRLQQTSQLAALGELAAGVCHELNNPLSAIMGYAQLLNMQDLPHSISQDVDKIVSQAKRAAKIVDDLLSFSHRQQVRRGAVNISEMVSQALSLREYALRMNNIVVKTDFGQDIPKTSGDEHQLTQVVLNLIMNAEQAMVECQGSGVLTISTRCTGNTIQISVADTGPGIQSDHLGRIFDPFFTTKEVGKGTGLGLSMCYGWVQAHEGTIWAESEFGHGATFYVELPVVETHEEIASPDKNHPPITGKRILVVDDEPLITDLLAETLRRSGQEVDIAHSGIEGWQAMQSKTYDIFLLDLRMPGMNGKELFGRLEEWNPNLAKRVIFLTGDSLNDETQSFLADAGNSCLSKPFTLEQLERNIQTQLVLQA